MWDLGMQLCTLAITVLRDQLRLVLVLTTTLSLVLLLDRTQQYTLVLFAKTPRELLLEKDLLNGHYAAYSEVAAMCYTTQCT